VLFDEPLVAEVHLKDERRGDNFGTGQVDLMGFFPSSRGTSLTATRSAHE